MSEKIESLNSPARDTRHESSDDDVRSLPDLEAWMNEIEDFVAEISNDLNDIGKSLGDRTLAAGSRGNSIAQRAPCPTRNETDKAKQPAADRLGSLKRRLANLKQEPGLDASPSQETGEANIDG